MDHVWGRPILAPIAAGPYRSHHIYQRVFSAAQCRRIIALGERLDPGQSLLESGDGREVADDTIRRSGVGWIAPTDESWWIFDKLGAVAERANGRYGYDLTGFGEDLQFTVYDEPGAFYSWHQDGLDGEVASRKLSMVVQLSDPETYVGGELEFFDVDEDLGEDDLAAFTALSIRQGAVIVFPSFEYHRVRPIRSGVRHSLVAWVSGPPFR